MTDNVRALPFRRGQTTAMDNRHGRERASLQARTRSVGGPMLEAVPPVPEGLTPAEAATWSRVAALLLEDGLLRNSSIEVLVIYARNECRLATLRESIAKHGELVERAGGMLVANPAARALTALQYQQLALQRMLGFAPSSGVGLRQGAGRELPPESPGQSQTVSFEF